MKTHELQALVELIRFQASTWLGGEACEDIEQLIKHTLSLQAQADKIAELHAQGYRLVKVEENDR